MKQRSRADLLAVYQKYLNGFVTEDMDAINECIEYPFTHVGETSVKTFDHFPLSPSEMKKPRVGRLATTLKLKSLHKMKQKLI